MLTPMLATENLKVNNDICTKQLNVFKTIVAAASASGPAIHTLVKTQNIKQLKPM